MKTFLVFFSTLCSICLAAQSDSISINAKLSADRKQLSIQQEITFHNRGNEVMDSIKLLNWIAAYQSKNTPLAKRKLEDRNADMYYAKQNEFGGLERLSVQIDNENITIENLKQENIFIKLPHSLAPKNSITIRLDYSLHLPQNKFTGYGYSNETVLLKYFFLVPDQLYGNLKRNYLDLEEITNFDTYWKIKIENEAPNYIYSNLKQLEPNVFATKLSTDPEILISKQSFPTFETEIDGQKINIELGYPIDFYENSRIALDTKQQFQFIKNGIGVLPDKIFISEKFKNKEDFFGNNDIKFWKLRYALFTPGENLDLDYFSIFSKKIVGQTFIINQEKNHWITNGIKSYLESEYLSKYYKNAKLLGDLPDTFTMLGLKPLKWFYASDMKLQERYGLAYQYMVSQNLDQAIATPYSHLSNFNVMAISNFETGSIFRFLADKNKSQSLNDFLSDYSTTNQFRIIDDNDFLNKLSIATHYSSDFLAPFIQQKQRVNFKINKFRREDGKMLVDISKNTDLPIPFRLETQSYKDLSSRRQYWFETQAKKSREIYIIPDSTVSKITINKDYSFPESNFRDNYLYTKGLFSNTKKLKFKLLKDIPNPEYNEVYINPKLNFNIYDEILMGINFSNSSLFPQPFLYSLTPYYSSGTGKFTGSGALAYSFLPANSFYNSLTTAVSGSYFHYAPELSYRKYAAMASMLFTKEPRSSIGQSVFASYTHYQKDLDAIMLLNNEYERYNIWSLGYGFSDRKMIHEKSLGIAYQGMEDFQKITAESFYRWEYAQNKKISFRLFLGAFLENKTRNNLFDFGISRVSNYSFSYGLFGQGETDGFWSQQFVLAEGGFKSLFPQTANQWISSINVDAHAWKMFNLYADVGFFKSKGWQPQFIWDSGVKLKIIPDFIEVYFPIQSSLGFEPSFRDYAKRIRFSLALNLNAIISSARRGWF